MFFYELKCGDCRQILVSNKRILGFFNKVENIVRQIPSTQHDWFNCVAHEVCEQLNMRFLELNATMDVGFLGLQ